MGHYRRNLPPLGLAYATEQAPVEGGESCEVGDAQDGRALTPVVRRRGYKLVELAGPPPVSDRAGRDAGTQDGVMSRVLLLLHE